jgi:hypothetical protein
MGERLDHILGSNFCFDDAVKISRKWNDFYEMAFSPKFGASEGDLTLRVVRVLYLFEVTDRYPQSKSISKAQSNPEPSDM